MQEQVLVLCRLATWGVRPSNNDSAAGMAALTAHHSRGMVMKINGIEVRRNDNGEWQYLSEGVNFEPDTWLPVSGFMSPFGGDGANQLFGLLEQSVDALRDMQRVVEMLMPGAKNIAIQDYQLLNEAPIKAAKIIAEIAQEG
jgi:hypothetical protein